MQNYSSSTMTCVDRYTSSRLKLNETIFHFAVYREGLGDQLYVVANWSKNATDPGELTEMLAVKLNGTKYNFTNVEGWEDPVCILPYVESTTEGEETITPSYALVPKNRAPMTYAGISISTYDLHPGAYATLPTLTITPPTIYGNYSHMVRWRLTAGEERSGWVTGMTMRVRESGNSTETALFTNDLHSYYTLQTDASIVGKEVCLVLEYRTYSADWAGYDLEDFVTCNRCVTPWQTVTRDGSVPFAPTGLTNSMLLAGGKVTVGWTAVSDPLNTISGYRLERSVNGGDYTSLYSGTSTQFRDTLPTTAQSVVYRVCAVNSNSVASPWTDSGTLPVAQSNLYVAKDGKWVRAAGVWIGNKRASPMARVK